MLTVFGSGRLTRDPEDTGKACKFTVACDYYMGEKKVTFLNCIAFGKRAETFNEYLYKGAPVAFQGLLEIREYEGKYYTTCIINDLTLPPKKTSENYTPPVDKGPEKYEEDGQIPF